MQQRFVRLAIPTLLALFSAAPAFAQIRIGVDLGAVRIRISPEAPPPPRMEVRMERPSVNFVWIAGYWDRQDDRWAWAPGRWEEPSQRGASWIRPEYRREGDAYRYQPGHWSHQRVEEGEDYSRWRKEHGRGNGNGNGKHKGHDRGNDWGHDREDHGRHH